MEAEITVIYSATISTGSFNTSEATRNSTVGKNAFKWTNEEIARLIQIVFRPILFTLGTVGNGLTVYIMRKSTLKDVSSCFYMSILALADTGK